MSTSTDFYLTALDNNITVLKALIEAEDVSQDTNLNPKVRAKLNIKLAEIQDVFQFATNAADLTDVSAEDMYFLVDADKFRDLSVSTSAYSVVINGNSVDGSITDQLLVDQIGSAYVFEAKHPDAAKPKQGIDFENDVKGELYAVDNKGMIKDLFRDLANQMFNTQYGVDIFSNESDLCNNTYTVTSDLLKSGGAIWQALTDASGLHMGSKDGANQAENIGRVLFENIVANDVARLQDLDIVSLVSIQSMDSPDNSPGDGQAAGGLNKEMRMYKMPFIAGDNIHFHLTYQYDVDQSTVVSGSGSYLDRIYEVVLCIV